MVAKARGYHRATFKGDRGVTHGEPLFSTMFNVVVDSVVRHWVTVVVESAEERNGHRQEDRHKNTLFYADDGMVASSNPQWLH